MDARKYIEKSARTEIVKWDKKDWIVIPFGLIGEVGSLAEVLKKSERDKKIKKQTKIEVREEIGDILWYSSALARRFGVLDFSWPDTGKHRVGIFESVTEISRCAADLLSRRSELISGIAEEKERVSELLNNIFVFLSVVAARYGMTLSEIADHAIQKNDQYWGEPSRAARCFDNARSDSYPHYERLPRKFAIDFREISRKGRKPELIISMNDVQLGDRLTDNTHDISGYRYHDVFHMAAAAFLGWSPVFRRMLKRKRKSNPTVDEVEDGARAAIIEEAIVSQVFRYGEKIKFRSVESVDEDLIKLIMEMAKDYECSAFEGKDWKLFVRKSIELFGKVKDGYVGKIHFDADQRSYKLAKRRA